MRRRRSANVKRTARHRQAPRQYNPSRGVQRACVPLPTIRAGNKRALAPARAPHFTFAHNPVLLLFFFLLLTHKSRKVADITDIREFSWAMFRVQIPMLLIYTEGCGIYQMPRCCWAREWILEPAMGASFVIFQQTRRALEVSSAGALGDSSETRARWLLAQVHLIIEHGSTRSCV